MKNKRDKYPEGYFVSKYIWIYIAIFTGVGIPLSITINNYAFIGMGPAIGVTLGIAVGQSIEDKMKKEGKIRPLTKKEKQQKQKAVWIGIVILILGFLALIGFYLLAK